MRKVQRSSSLVRKIKRKFFGIPEKKYFTSGDRACREMIRNARRCRRQDLEAEAIMAWARFDLTREIIHGFWEQKAVCI